MEGSSQKPHHVFSCANSVQTDTVCRDFRMIYAIVISALLSSTAAIELSDAWKRMELCYIVGPICTSSDVENLVLHGGAWVPYPLDPLVHMGVVSGGDYSTKYQACNSLGGERRRKGKAAKAR